MTTAYHPDFFLEAHFVHGLEQIVHDELQNHLSRHFTQLGESGPTYIRFQLVNNPSSLQYLRTATAFSLVSLYKIPRPKALLGQAYFQRLQEQINSVIQASPPNTFHSFRVEAAGSDSTVFRRLRQQISQAIHLINDQEAGDLLIRVLPVKEKNLIGWKVLCRLTPRPLSIRQWRVIDFPGALNATIAAAMMRISNPQPTDRVLNLMCGSGTLMIERLLINDAKSVVGCDIDAEAIHTAQANIHSAGLSDQIKLLKEDATRLPFSQKSFDVIVADLPWGHLIGGHIQNQMLYPQIIEEAARIATDGGRLILITTEIRLIEQTLKRFSHMWQLKESIRLSLKTTYPRIYLLIKRKSV